MPDKPEVNETETGRPTHAGRFVHGNKAAKGKKLSSRQDDTLKAMQHVLSEPDNETRQHKELRAWMRENRSAFMSRLLDLEKEQRPPPDPKEPVTPQGGNDESETTLLGLIDKLLDTFQEEAAKPDERQKNNG